MIRKLLFISVVVIASGCNKDYYRYSDLKEKGLFRGVKYVKETCDYENIKTELAKYWSNQPPVKYFFDEHGNIDSIQTLKDSITSNVFKNGWLLRSESYTMRDKLKYRINYDYLKFDEQGNWILQKIICDEYIQYTKRDIEYY